MHNDSIGVARNKIYARILLCTRKDRHRCSWIPKKLGDKGEQFVPLEVCSIPLGDGAVTHLKRDGRSDGEYSEVTSERRGRAVTPLAVRISVDREILSNIPGPLVCFSMTGCAGDGSQYGRS